MVLGWRRNSQGLEGFHLENRLQNPFVNNLYLWGCQWPNLYVGDISGDNLMLVHDGHVKIDNGDKHGPCYTV